MVLFAEGSGRSSLLIFHFQPGQGLFCCCKQASVNPDELDRIELAFRRIDLNNDGVITWDEFLKVSQTLTDL